jgi:hypothetical protein
MAIVQTALALAGAAYTPQPRMPLVDIRETRGRVRKRFEDLMKRADLAEAIETDYCVTGKSRREFRVAKSKRKPVLIFIESLKQEPIHRAEAVTFEWLDVKGNGIAPDTTAACIYDPPSGEMESKLPDVNQILTTYFSEGAYSIEDETPLLQTLERKWA